MPRGWAVGGKGGKAPRLFPVQSPQATDFKAESLRLRDELLGKHPASKRMTLRFYSQLDNLENRLNQLPGQPSRPERSIRSGDRTLGRPFDRSGIISWADPSIDPGIALQPVSPEETPQACRRGWLAAARIQRPDALHHADTGSEWAGGRATLRRAGSEVSAAADRPRPCMTEIRYQLLSALDEMQ